MFFPQHLPGVGVLCLLLCQPLSSQTELFISEYVEGTGTVKCIEIFNPGTAPVDLAAGSYKLVLYANGSSSGITKSNLTGIIQPLDVHVVCEASSDINSHQQFTAGPNGNDAIALQKNGSFVDLVGNIGCNPGLSWSDGEHSTLDKTLVRVPCILYGIKKDPDNQSCGFPTLAQEWLVYPANDVSHLGWHDISSFTLEVNARAESSENANDGYAEVIVSDGIPDFQYKWSTGDDKAKIDGLGQGEYSVTVTDKTGCEQTATIHIHTLCPPMGQPCNDGDRSTFNDQQDGNCNCKGESCSKLKMTLKTTDISCSDQRDGSAEVRMAGGKRPYRITWSTGSHRNRIRGLSEDRYWVRVEDGNGCTASSYFHINRPGPLKLILKHNPESNPGKSDGIAHASASGGTPPYRYIWSNGVRNPGATELAGGWVSVVVTDYRGCRLTDSVFITTICPRAGLPCDDGDHQTFDDLTDGKCGCKGSPCPAINLNLNVSDISCFGLRDGHAEVNPEGGQEPYQIRWSDGTSDNIMKTIVFGNFSIQVSDRRGCTAIQEFEIKRPSRLRARLSVLPESNPGSKDGAVSIEPFGGTPPYSCLWSTGERSFTLSSLSQGWYFVKIRDNRGCIREDSAFVEIKCPAKGETCDDSNPMTFNDREDGSCNCMGTMCPQIDLNLKTKNISCFQEADGMASIQPSGGQTPYQIQWSNGVEGTSIMDLSPELYWVKLTDTNGCITADTFEITQPRRLATSFNISPESRPGRNDGSVQVIVSGGTPPYRYFWSEEETDSLISNLSGGWYDLEIRDKNDCQILDSVFVETLCAPPGSVCDDGDQNTYNDAEDGDCFCAGTPCPDIESNLTVRDISCHNLQDGSAQVNPTGGQLPYTISWSNGEKTEKITNLDTQNYFVEIIDQNGCKAVSEFKISQPNPIAVDLIKTPESSPKSRDGSIIVSANGGSPPYFYSWSTGQQDSILDQVGSGVYQVTVSDHNQCTIFDSTFLEVLCPEAGLPCDDENPLTYQDHWDGDCNCSGPPCPDTLFQLLTSSVLCNGGQDGKAALIFDKGDSIHQVKWSIGSEADRIDSLPAGEYSVWVADQNGCSVLQFFEIPEPDLIYLKLLSFLSSGPKAPDGRAAAIAGGGTPPFNFEWSNGIRTNEILDLPGHYYITVTDQNNCSSSDSLEILSRPCSLTADLIFSNPTCYDHDDGQMQVVVHNGVNPVRYSWNHMPDLADPVANQMTAGNYTVVVSDTVGCSDTIEHELIDPSPLIIDYSITHESRAGQGDGKIELTISGGRPPYRLDWDKIEKADSVPLPPGKYHLTVFDANGCVQEETFVIQQGQCEISAQIKIDSSCTTPATGFVRIYPEKYSGQLHYDWSHDSLWNADSVQGLPPGSYFVRISDDVKCTLELQFVIPAKKISSLKCETIKSKSSFQVPSGELRVSIPPGSQFTEIVGPDSSLLITPEKDNVVLSKLKPGIYTVTAQSSEGCDIGCITKIDTVICTLNISAEVENAGCAKPSGSIQLDLHGNNGPVQINWHDETLATENTITNLYPGFYPVDVRDGFCQVRDTFFVGRDSIVNVNYDLVQTNCHNNKSTLTIGSIQGGSEPFLATLNTKPFDIVKESITLSEGINEFKVRDNTGCVFLDSIEIHNDTIDKVRISRDTSIWVGESLILSAKIADHIPLVSYYWVGNQEKLCLKCAEVRVRPRRQTQYSFVSQDTCGIVKLKSLDVRILDFTTIFVPNAITPNGDGVNDYLAIYGGRNVLSIVSFKLYNKFGNLVFQKSNFEANTKLPELSSLINERTLPNVFMYLLEVKLLDGSTRRSYGDLMVLK